MAEYVEREALEGSFDAAAMAFLEKGDNLFDRKSVLAGMSIAAGIVHTVPAADVAPVVHGRWKWNEFGQMYCSQCLDQPELAIEKPYCSNCGAKMDMEDTDGLDTP